ncbi:MAG: vitamin K epoxide reductase family protein [Streptosporangiales bacterium]
MAAPKPAGSRATSPGRSAAGRPAAAKRDKGTRGGRPEAPAGGAGRAAGQPARQSAQRPARPRAAAAAEAAAGPVGAIRVPPLWFQLTTWVLAIGGFGVSSYLTITHFDSSVPLVCSDKGLINCGLVTSSPQSYVFGIPVAVLGLAFYLFMVAAASPWAWRSKYPAVAWVRLASLVVGIVFVLYLVYTELFTLKAICLWCTSVHVITFLLFVLIVISAAVGYGFRDPELSR